MAGGLIRTARHAGYDQYYSQSNPKDHQRSNNIVMYPVAKKAAVSGDDDSERNILPPGQIGLASDPFGTGILRTTEIQQTVRGKDEKDDGSEDSLGGLERPVV
ncbi:MAG: hypothetical protein Q9191_003517 [Dirinaria sp. TL-2023a]